MLFKILRTPPRPSQFVIAGKSTRPNRIYDRLAHMTSLWLFMTFLNPCYVSLTEDQILHLHFLDLCAKPVGGKLTYTLINSGFEAAFHTFFFMGFLFLCVCP